MQWRSVWLAIGLHFGSTGPVLFRTEYVLVCSDILIWDIVQVHAVLHCLGCSLCFYLFLATAALHKFLSQV